MGESEAAAALDPPSLTAMRCTWRGRQATVFHLLAQRRDGAGRLRRRNSVGVSLGSPGKVWQGHHRDLIRGPAWNIHRRLQVESGTRVTIYFIEKKTSMEKSSCFVSCFFSSSSVSTLMKVEHTHQRTHQRPHQHTHQHTHQLAAVDWRLEELGIF